MKNQSIRKYRLRDAQFQPNVTLDNTARQVLRKTYGLLSLTLIFSALCAFHAMASQVVIPFPIMLIGLFALPFATQMCAEKPYGIILLFLTTGFMGYVIGPILNMTLHQFTNGSQIVITSLGATAAIFVTLSAYTVFSRKNFTYMGGFLAIAAMVGILAVLANLFFQLPALQLLISGAFAVISAGYILFMTSMIVQGGETNAIRATIILFISIFNLFISLLQILSAFAGNSRN